MDTTPQILVLHYDDIPLSIIKSKLCVDVYLMVKPSKLISYKIRNDGNCKLLLSDDDEKVKSLKHVKIDDNAYANINSIGCFSIIDKGAEPVSVVRRRESEIRTN